MLPKTYQTFSPRILKELLKTFSTIPVDREGDSFGKIYEYFLAEFAMTEGQGGGEFYTPLSIVPADGVQVSVMNAETREQEPRTIRLVDWEHPEENDFLAIEQLSLKGPLYTCIPDVVLFVNGLPWAVVELKRPGVPVRQAFDENLTSYKHAQNGVPQLFAFNALLVASNGTDAKVGALTADWDRFFEWKRVEREDEPRRVSLEVLLRGTCEKGRLLDLVRNFSLFSEHKSGLAKILAQNHQFLGVNNAIRSALAAREAGHGRAGVF